MPQKPSAGATTVLTIRVPRDLDRRLAREARRRRRTRSHLAREILQAGLEGHGAEDPAVEARRQSLRATERPSEHEAMEFVAAAADLKDWR
jgi:predicted transcriptional regulator